MVMQFIRNLTQGGQPQAADDEVEAKSGKQKAKELAVYVAEAFDDKTPLDIGPDAHVNTIRGADWHTREGDEEWLWNLDYDFVLDAEYDAATT